MRDLKRNTSQYTNFEVFNLPPPKDILHVPLNRYFTVAEHKFQLIVFKTCEKYSQVGITLLSCVYNL